MNQKFILIPILILLLFSTCKKDEEEIPCSTTEPCPCIGDDCIDLMMDYTYFLPGTWWVYEEQNSGLRDSVYVYEAFEGENEEGLRYFVVRMHSEYDGYNYYHEFAETVSTISITRPECQVQQMDRSKTKPGDFIGTDVFFFSPFILNDYRYVWGGGQISIDSVQYADESLIEEIYFDIDNCNSEDFEYVGFHLQPNIGISRKSKFDQDREWNLIDYHIIQ